MLAVNTSQLFSPPTLSEFVYIRSEYPHATAALTAAIHAARRDCALGAGAPHAFDLQVRVGAGAYVCGEEAAPIHPPRPPAMRGAA
jgi:NADH:ubiquinone oxidoreductase subunit F (NADH-binding)